jgi:hypothetical protein
MFKTMWITPTCKNIAEKNLKNRGKKKTKNKFHSKSNPKSKKKKKRKEGGFKVVGRVDKEIFSNGHLPLFFSRDLILRFLPPPFAFVNLGSVLGTTFDEGFTRWPKHRILRILRKAIVFHHFPDKQRNVNDRNDDEKVGRFGIFALVAIIMSSVNRMIASRFSNDTPAAHF